MMAVCKRCGKALPTPSGVLGTYENRGLVWLVIVTITVSLMVIGMALGMMASISESELPDTWKLSLTLAFGAIMASAIVFSMARALKARKFSHYCSDCIAVLIAERLPNPEEFGAHKVRMKKE